MVYTVIQNGIFRKEIVLFTKLKKKEVQNINNKEQEMK